MPCMVFRHPEPEHSSPRLLPVFLPYHGCPNRCTYCAQHLQTGVGIPSLPQVYHHLRENLEERSNRNQQGIGLAFFGGTFTALPMPWQKEFLALAGRYRSSSLVTHVRCSTRPDRVDPGHLAWLHAQGLDMVELGVQSFCTNVLDQSRRGYDGQSALDACVMVQRSGLELGIQLMPGLPGSTSQTWGRDVDQASLLRPKAVRIYPCLVLQGTPLARAFQRQAFRPWGMQRTVWSVGQALLTFWGRGIPVIRIGLAPEQNLLSAILAGPWHPALGQMAKSSALYSHILGVLTRLPETDLRIMERHIFVPRRFAGEFWGHCRNLAPALKRIGFPRAAVTFWDRSSFCIVTR